MEESDPVPLAALASFLSLALVSFLSLASFLFSFSLFSSFSLLSDPAFLLPSVHPIYPEYLPVPAISAYLDLTNQCHPHFLLLAVLFEMRQNHLFHPHHLPQKECVIIFLENLLFSEFLLCHPE